MLLEPLMEYRATKQILGNPKDPVLRAFFGGDEVSSGVNVDENSALNYSAVWCATRVLSSTTSMLPRKVYRRLKGGGKEEATDHRMYRIVHRRPNPEMGAMMFGLPLVQQQVNGGNAYAELERNSRGEIINQWPIHCSRVTPYRDGGVLRYAIRNNDGGTGYLDKEDILHFPNIITSDGICGKGVIQHARESIGMGIATERHGASYFGNGAKPGIVVNHPHRFSDTARQNFRREWNELYQGPNNAHRMALLAEGATITQLGASMDDAQFLQTREHNINEFARWYGTPPHLLYDLRRATFSNIDAQEIEYVTFSALPLLVIHEQEYTRKLFTEEEQEEYFVEHVLDALLRGDALARAQSLQLQLQNGALNIDEWRAIENRNPIQDGSGKKHFIQMNMTTTEKAGEEPPKPAAPKVGPQVDEPPVVDGEPQQRHGAKFILAHRSLMAQITGRLIRKEAKAIRSAANKPEVFLSSMEAFYVEHELHFVSELIPSLRSALSILNPKLDAGTEAKRIAKHHIDQARSELLEAAGVKPEQFKDAIETRVSAWENTGADALADAELSNLIGE